MTNPASAPPARVIVLHRSALPASLADAFRACADAPPLFTLARALATTPGWRANRPLTLVVRGGAEGVLAAIGRFDEGDEVRLRLLHHQLRTMLPRTILLDHRRVERACEILAEKLRNRFDPKEIAAMRFVGIPRGGLIVLGILSYALDLARDQLLTSVGRSDPTDAPLIVVDDCVLSGLRVGQFLAHQRSEAGVTVATLFSHPDLRSDLPARVPQVREVISAFDLHDYAPEAEGEGYEAWRARWLARSDPRASWIGQPDHVCFPWGEPEGSIWNAATEREEPMWNMIPPELCLKHRGRSTPAALSTYLQPSGGGGHRPAPDVVHTDLDGEEIVIGNLDSGHAYALDGVSALMWREILKRGDEESAAEAVADSCAADPIAVLADMRAFVSDLGAAGLLERSDG